MIEVSSEEENGMKHSQGDLFLGDYDEVPDKIDSLSRSFYFVPWMSNYTFDMIIKLLRCHKGDLIADKFDCIEYRRSPTAFIHNLLKTVDSRYFFAFRPTFSTMPSYLLLFNAELMDISRWLIPTPFEYFIRAIIFSRIRKIIDSIYPLSVLKLYGSFSSGLGIPTSDIDCSVDMSPYSANIFSAMGIISSLLRKSPFFCNIETITKAKVPIIKCSCKRTGISIDISFNQDASNISAEKIMYYSYRYPLFNPLVRLLKLLLRQRSLDVPYEGGIGGYVLINFIIVYFNQRHSTFGYKPHKDIELAVHFLDFLQMFSSLHDNFSVGMCVDTIVADGYYNTSYASSQYGRGGGGRGGKRRFSGSGGASISSDDFVTGSLVAPGLALATERALRKRSIESGQSVTTFRQSCGKMSRIGQLTHANQYNSNDYDIKGPVSMLSCSIPSQRPINSFEEYECDIDHGSLCEEIPHATKSGKKKKGRGRGEYIKERKAKKERRERGERDINELDDDALDELDNEIRKCLFSYHMSKTPNQRKHFLCKLMRLKRIEEIVEEEEELRERERECQKCGRGIIFGDATYKRDNIYSGFKEYNIFNEFLITQPVPPPSIFSLSTPFYSLFSPFSPLSCRLNYICRHTYDKRSILKGDKSGTIEDKYSALMDMITQRMDDCPNQCFNYHLYDPSYSHSYSSGYVVNNPFSYRISPSRGGQEDREEEEEVACEKNKKIGGLFYPVLSVSFTEEHPDVIEDGQKKEMGPKHSKREVDNDHCIDLKLYSINGMEMNCNRYNGYVNGSLDGEINDNYFASIAPHRYNSDVQIELDSMIYSKQHLEDSNVEERRSGLDRDRDTAETMWEEDGWGEKKWFSKWHSKQLSKSQCERSIIDSSIIVPKTTLPVPPLSSTSAPITPSSFFPLRTGVCPILEPPLRNNGGGGGGGQDLVLVDIMSDRRSSSARMATVAAAMVMKKFNKNGKKGKKGKKKQSTRVVGSRSSSR
ncbi:hypothetical protein ADUPG1_011287 [Aduncisulcus paluster]|uniref:Poly(A) RNA polymerase mitochondrial-like central palm domain-containing protein n=1 Tax=Aduncisulcus paluster TaxID=2918883 RepID=A0ABQ5JVF3_9EUKA|nr:hypothetical protein ADUPG1_011287 [Aduncisulcus paluster]